MQEATVKILLEAAKQMDITIPKTAKKDKIIATLKEAAKAGVTAYVFKQAAFETPVSFDSG